MVCVCLPGFTIHEIEITAFFASFSDPQSGTNSWQEERDSADTVLGVTFFLLVLVHFESTEILCTLWYSVFQEVCILEVFILRRQIEVEVLWEFDGLTSVFLWWRVSYWYVSTLNVACQYISQFVVFYVLPLMQFSLCYLIPTEALILLVYE